MSLVAVFAVAAMFAGYQLLTWPYDTDLATLNPASTAFIDAYVERGGAAGSNPVVSWQWVPDGEISPHVKRAAIAAEDMEFFSHNGISTFEIKTAVREAVEEGKGLRGASTITQQLVKNLWLSPSRNPWRKVKELILTRQLEKRLDKHRILELYLNVVEFGEGIYGVEAAASHYFGTTARMLTEEQAAMLAASLPRPSTWHPGSTSDAYADYVATIRGRMDRASFLWRHLGRTSPLPAIESLPVPSLDNIPLPEIREAPTPDSSNSERIYRRPIRKTPGIDSPWAG